MGVGSNIMRPKQDFSPKFFSPWLNIFIPSLVFNSGFSQFLGFLRPNDALKWCNFFTAYILFYSVLYSIL